jgi:uncharacterized protein (DUF4415 family)
MSDKRTTKRSLDTAATRRTDWSRVDALSDAEIATAVHEDPDAAPLLTPAWLAKANLVRPTEKEAISIRLDKDVLEHFRQQPRWQTRINAILRTVMDHEKSDAP